MKGMDKRKKICTISELYNEYLDTWFFQRLKKKLGDKYVLVDLFLVDTYSYDNWFENEESYDTAKK